jgi:predicted Fe-S protein YdhL (DUF1289 family)
MSEQAVEMRELRLLILKTIGAKLNEGEEIAKKSVQHLIGGLEALSEGVKSLDSVKTYWQKDVDDGKVSAEECKKALDIVTTCQGCLRSLHEKYLIMKMTRDGEHQGWKKSGDIIEAMHKEEKGRLENLLRSLESKDLTVEDKPKPNAVGVNPGMSLAAQRRQQSVVDSGGNGDSSKEIKEQKRRGKRVTTKNA